MMFKSVQTRTLFFIVMIITLLLIAIGAFSVYTVQKYVGELTRKSLTDYAKGAAMLVAEKSNIMKRSVTDSDLKILFTDKELQGIKIVDRRIDKVYDYSKTETGQHIYKDKEDYVAGLAAIKDCKYMTGKYIVTEARYADAYENVNTLTTFIIVILIVGFIVMWPLGKRVSFAVQKPIKKLSVAATQIAEGDISHGIEVLENNELKVIADSFNKMLDNLKATMQQVLDKSGEAASMHEIMEYVEQTYDELPSGIISINNIGEIITFNSTAEHLTGVSASDVLGLDIKNPIPESITNLVRHMARCLSRGSLQLKTLGDIKNVSGEKVPIEYSINIQFGVKNEVLGAICLFRSISDIERFEESASRSRALGALGEMAASLAHEIKNPLASIRGYAQYVRRDMTEASGDTEEMDIIINEVDKLTDTLDKFLKFARPETPETEPVDVRDLIRYVIRLTEKDIPRNIEVIGNLENIPLAMIDKRQFEPVLLNLILNAVQAMPKGGKIIVSTVYEAARNMVRIDVQDDGEGIPSELSEKIFQPFFTTKENGTGLGLAICSRVVESHKGIMEVESIEGEMTKFTILLQAVKKG